MLQAKIEAELARELPVLKYPDEVKAITHEDTAIRRRASVLADRLGKVLNELSPAPLGYLASHHLALANLKICLGNFGSGANLSEKLALFTIEEDTRIALCMIGDHFLEILHPGSLINRLCITIESSDREELNSQADLDRFIKGRVELLPILKAAIFLIQGLV